MKCLLIHDPSYGYLDVSGKRSHKIQRGVYSLNKVRETFAEIISEMTGKSLDEIYEIAAEDHYFTADEAIKFGLASGIFKGDTNGEIFPLMLPNQCGALVYLIRRKINKNDVGNFLNFYKISGRLFLEAKSEVRCTKALLDILQQYII